MTDLLTQPAIDEETSYMAAQQRSQKLGQAIDNIQNKILTLLAKDELDQGETEKLHLLCQSLHSLVESKDINKLL